MLHTAGHSVVRKRAHRWPIRWSILAALCCVFMASASHAQQRYYRYLNDEGVKVIHSTIPPQYVKNGYEVVTAYGEVLEVVAPAPSEEEAEAYAAQREREARLAEWDEYLLKRYSTPDDIRAAKKRKVGDFEASLSILRGNANSIQAQIETVQARAANFERQGRKVPEVILTNLSELQEELAETNRLIAIRKENQRSLEEKFDSDIERFKIIRPETDKAADDQTAAMQ